MSNLKPKHAHRQWPGRNIGHVLGAIGLVGLLAGCDPKPVPDPQPELTSIDLIIDHRFGNERLQLGDVQYNTLNNPIGVDVLDYYLGKPAFQKPDGSWVSSSSYFLVKARSGRPDTLRVTDIPVGTYTRLRFTLGVDSADNHADPAAWPNEHGLSLMNGGLMHWGWNAGYIFFKIEGRYRNSASLNRGYSYHIGRDDLVSHITSPPGLDIRQVTGKSTPITIKMQVDRFFNEPHAHIISDSSYFSHSTLGDAIVPVLHGNMQGMFVFEP